MATIRKCGWLIVIAVVALNPAVLLADTAEDERRKPPTRVTEKLSPHVYQQIEAAQAAMEAGDLDGAEAQMDALKADAGSLNDYERAQMHNFYAAIHYEQGRVDATIADYVAILKLEAPPEQIRTNSLFRLAQLYFVKEDYARSIRVLDEWMKWVDAVRPEAHMLMAQAHYQLDAYTPARAAVIAAMREARRRQQPLQENWLALLRAIYYEQDDYRSAVKVLVSLVSRWPGPSYYKQLSGMLGLLGQQKGQLYVMHGAYVAGMLESESELLNLARLYMAEDAPLAAIEVLERGMQSGVVAGDVANLQLLAQAMALAKDVDGQIPVLERAAEASGEALHYLYLGQAQMGQYRWAEAAASLRRALSIGGLDREGSVHMQLGTAYFNLERYGQALQAFKDASAHSEQAQQAEQWIGFVRQEIKRTEAIRDL